MSISVSELLIKCGLILHDDEYVRWTKDELIGWINDAASEIVVRRPPAGTVNEVISLVEGAKQTIPDVGSLLIDVVRNVSGKQYPIQRTSRNMLESQDPTWYYGSRKNYVKHFTYDDRLPKMFYVWPAVTGGTQVEIAYSRAPEKVNTENDSLALGREYTSAVISFVLYRALGKDSEYANGQMAGMHYQAFNEALGVNNQTQLIVSPNGAEA
jgi:hypothetical protein